MQPLDKYYNPRTRILWHIGFWFAFLMYHVLIIGSFEDNLYNEVFIERLFDIPIKILATYFVLYLLIPKFFMQKQVLLFSLLFTGTLIVAAFLHMLYYHYVVNPLLYSWRPNIFSPGPLAILKSILGIYPVVVLAAFIKLGKNWYEKDKTAQKLEKEKVDAELKFLKAQIHPHFLFNTLNNLYALTLKKSSRASEVVLKLSDLLDYMLYESNTPTVSLKKEIDLVETYIDLEKMRYGDKLRITYNITGEVAGKTIPPMLILPFVENSFKHGVSQQLKEMWINIDLEVNANQLSLRVENSKSNGTAENLQSYKEGIGLKNVKRRLELLYGDNYELHVSDEKNIFRIFLSINMDEPYRLKKR